MRNATVASIAFLAVVFTGGAGLVALLFERPAVAVDFAVLAVAAFGVESFAATAAR